MAENFEMKLNGGDGGVGGGKMYDDGSSFLALDRNFEK